MVIFNKLFSRHWGSKGHGGIRCYESEFSLGFKGAGLISRERACTSSDSPANECQSGGLAYQGSELMKPRPWQPP